MKYLLVYLIVINADAFLLMLVDKQRAIKKKWRIPERHIMNICALGGSLGGLLGMYLFRHKTRHPRVTISIPIL